MSQVTPCVIHGGIKALYDLIKRLRVFSYVTRYSIMRNVLQIWDFEIFTPQERIFHQLPNDTKIISTCCWNPKLWREKDNEATRRTCGHGKIVLEINGFKDQGPIQRGDQRAYALNLMSLKSKQHSYGNVTDRLSSLNFTYRESMNGR